MIDPLVFVRAVHLLATILLTGGVFFRAFVAEPALAAGALRRQFRSRLRWLVAISLGIAVVSGAAWLTLLVTSIGEPSLAEFGERSWLFLTQTQFGMTWLVRFALALLLTAGISASRRDWYEGVALRSIMLIASAAFAGTLAWAGHGGATPGSAGFIHGAADTLHLVAAAAWLGGLVPLAVLLRWSLQADHIQQAPLLDVLRHFSNLGIAAVAVLLVSGAINTVFSIDSLDALFASTYGRLLLLKIALFVAMATFAAINRLKWMPALAARADTPAAPRAVQQIHVNAFTEISLGIIIVVLVAWLGTLPPGLESDAHLH
jgi:putative copper resistance protein D